MAKLVNLNRFRKDRARAAARKEADRNAAFHGLTKAEKARATAEAAREARTHESGRMVPDDPDGE